MLYAEIFLASYRFFMPAQEVLDGLIGWYNCEADEEETTGSSIFVKIKKKSIMARSIKVLITWIRNHYWDFHENDRLHASLDNFMNLISNQSYGAHVKINQAVREQVYLCFIPYLETHMVYSKICPIIFAR